MDNTAKKVAVIMGSDSDLPAVKPAIDKLKSFGVPVEAHVMSAHRTPALAADFAADARKNGFGDIIAAAGKAVTPGGAVEICHILGRDECLRRHNLGLDKLKEN